MLRAVDIAETALKTLLTAPPELPVQPLALLRRQPDTTVLTFGQAEMSGLFRQEALAGLIRGREALTCLPEGSGRRYVLFDPSPRPARLRFTLAHELGHLLLSHLAEGSREEREANIFAAQLLMPLPVLDRLLAEGRLTPAALAERCGVSCGAAAAMLRSARLPVSTDLLRSAERHLFESAGGHAAPQEDEHAISQ